MKVISPAFEDRVYDAFASRIEPQPSVQIWSYVKEDNSTRVRIHFVDEEIVFQIEVAHNNLTELQNCLETVDNYFAAKKLRS